MHGSCETVNDDERYVIMVLVISLLLRDKVVAHVRILYVVAMTTHKSPLVFHLLGLDVRIQFCSNCKPGCHPI